MNEEPEMNYHEFKAYINDLGPQYTNVNIKF